MEKKLAKSKKELAAEQAEIDRLRDELRSLCSRVPGSVLSGSVQRAMSWKQQAHDSLRLANSKAPTLAKLRNARDMMIRAAVQPAAERTSREGVAWPFPGDHVRQKMRRMKS